MNVIARKVLKSMCAFDESLSLNCIATISAGMVAALVCSGAM